MIVFKPKYIGLIKNPIIIIGEKPNTTRDNSTFSLVGNRTGDFVAEAIGDRENIILTNVVNILYPGDFDRYKGVADGINDLIHMFEEHKPRKIICLGGIAKEYVDSIVYDCPRVYLAHPSWINRFRSSLRHEYINILSNELDT